MQDSKPRYASLRDYLRLLRRQRVPIALLTVAFGAAGLLISLYQTPTYTAQASVAFRDLGQDLPLIGGEGTVTQQPVERAARNAALINGGTLTPRVQERLDTERSLASLSEAVVARVSLQTNFVEVQARSDDPEFAADLANAFAQVAAAHATRQERRRVDRAVDSLEQRLEGMDEESLPAQFVQNQIAQLQAVRGLTQAAAQVSQRAHPPATPTSPRTSLNTVLGVVVGFAFGLLVGFVRDSLDRRIRDSADAHGELGYPILGRIGSAALGGVGLASNGARWISPQDLESFRMLRTNLAFFETESPLKTILVTSGLAQEGKSTVAASLASAAAAAGQRTLLVDCDLRRPTLASRLGLNQSPGLADYLVGKAAPGDVLQLRSVNANGRASAEASPHPAPTPGSEGGQATLVCITSGERATQPAELLASERCYDFLAKVSKAYDLVVIDSSPLLASVDPLELIPFVDGVLLCVRVSWSTRDEARAVKHALGRLPERPTGIVLTGLKSSEEEYGYYGYEYSG